jgi:hypothetical protein
VVACARAALALERREEARALLHEIEHAAIEACEYLTRLQPE